MSEIELFDKLNPKRDLPQAVCDLISKVYEVISKDYELEIEKMKYCGNCRHVGDYGVLGCFCYKKEEYILPHFKCDKWELEISKELKEKKIWKKTNL